MSEETRNLAAGGEEKPNKAQNGAAAPAAPEEDSSAGQDSQAKRTASGVLPKELPPAPPRQAEAKGTPKPYKFVSMSDKGPVPEAKRQAKSKTKVTAKVTQDSKAPGNGAKPADGGAQPSKGDSSRTELQFSSPSSNPPARRGLKPDPDKVRRARGAHQQKRSGTAAPGHRGSATENGNAEKSPEQQMAIPDATRLSGAIRPTRPTNPRLFQRHRRGLSLAILLVAASGIAWWSGAFQKRTDLANNTEITEPAPLETAAAKPNRDEVRAETETLLSDLGLFTGSAGEASGEKLEAAIRDYQTMAGIPVDGQPSYDLLVELRAVAGAIEAP